MSVMCSYPKVSCLWIVWCATPSCILRNRRDSFYPSSQFWVAYAMRREIFDGYFERESISFTANCAGTEFRIQARITAARTYERYRSSAEQLLNLNSHFLNSCFFKVVRYSMRKHLTLDTCCANQIKELHSLWILATISFKFDLYLFKTASSFLFLITLIYRWKKMCCCGRKGLTSTLVLGIMCMFKESLQHTSNI